MASEFERNIEQTEGMLRENMRRGRHGRSVEFAHTTLERISEYAPHAAEMIAAGYPWFFRGLTPVAYAENYFIASEFHVRLDENNPNSGDVFPGEIRLSLVMQTPDQMKAGNVTLLKNLSPLLVPQGMRFETYIGPGDEVQRRLYMQA
ncbi:MAG: hypothetical protein ACREGI_02655 [Candidatus Levyibacteriota bacterium]